MPDIKNILVIGSNGQLGQSLQRVAGNYPLYNVVFADRQLLDLSEINHIDAYFKQHTFDVIINCAAHTAVDKAESEPELADAINHQAVKKVAINAKQQHAKLIHVSTDYVFNGEQYRPYIETDAVDPKGVYGATKLAGEQAVLQAMQTNALIIRTSWVYSEFGSNFVKTMRKLGRERDSLAVIYDQVGAPTYAGDLAKAIMHVVESELFGQSSFSSQVYHYSNEGVCSWYDFAQAIFEYDNISCDVSAIETKDYPTAAKRPHYSVLNKHKIKQEFSIAIPYWKDSLAACLQALQENKQ